MKWRASLLLLAATLVPPAHGEILGTKPKYLAGEPSRVPNARAITRAMWAPGLDEGYVPQGVAFEAGHVLVSGYRSTDPGVGTGPCRVFRIEASTGREAGSFDMPGECGHAGGIAGLGGGVIVVSDTRRLYRIDVARALATGKGEDGLTATLRLAGRLKGSFAAFDGRDLWIGTYDKDASKARLNRLAVKLFDEQDGKTLTDGMADASLPIPAEAQGAAFDKDGALWLASSSSRQGTLYRLDPKTGAVLARHEVAIGIEDLEFDDEGGLWSVSEAGARRWSTSSTTYPVVFRLDPSKLK
jgi:outer membrane protein assembly factor BamB